jgi:hypothetical protein
MDVIISRRGGVTMGNVEPGMSRCLPTTGRAIQSVLFLCLSLCDQPCSALAEGGGVVAEHRQIATRDDEALVPVATDAGIRPMLQRDYESYVRSMGHLPVMSKAYVFGRTIPQPKTDKLGHIHLSAGPPAAPVGGKRK